MSGSALPDAVARVLIDEDLIQARVRELGRQITTDYSGRRPALVTVLRGGVVFLSDLCRAIELDVTLDFMAVSSYGAGAVGSVRITKDLDDPIDGRPVIVVEDIIDTGLTLNYLLRMLKGRNPESIEVCTMLDKDVRRIVDLPIAYRGFSIPDEFVVGYGLDLRGSLRDLPYIASLKEEVLLGP